MSKKALRFIGVIALLIGGYFLITTVLKNKIKAALSVSEPNTELTYKNLDINLLKRSIQLDSLHYDTPTLKAEARHGEINGFGIFSFLFKNRISVNKVKLNTPQVTLIQVSDTTKQAQDNSQDRPKKELLIKNIKLKKGTFQILENGKTSLSLRSFDGSIKNLKMNKETRDCKIPFTMESYSLKGNEFSFLLNKLQTLKAAKFEIKSKNATFKNLQIAPNYSRKEYIKVIPYEKDLMAITIPSLTLTNYNFSAEDSGKFTAEKILMAGIDTHIYRNKLVKDDPRNKPLYSRMLRELPFKLNIDTLQIDDATLTYEEVQEKTEKTGKVFFKNLNVTGKNITNINLKSSKFPETQFHFNSKFMGVAPLTVDWRFKINNPRDEFRITGQGTDITADAINNFFVPGMNMKASGDPIKTLKFDFNGNNETAQGTFQMIYDDLKIDVLKKDGKEKNDIFSAIANIFVSHKNEANKDPVEVEDVERDKKRSFWNYLWASVFTGLKETML